MDAAITTTETFRSPLEPLGSSPHAVSIIKVSSSHYKGEIGRDVEWFDFKLSLFLNFHSTITTNTLSHMD